MTKMSGSVVRKIDGNSDFYSINSIYLQETPGLPRCKNL